MKTLLLESVTSGRIKQLQYLLAQSRRFVAGGFGVPVDLDVNYADRSGITPLHSAVLKGSLPMVKLLLEAGANCLSADSLGQSPLDLAESRHLSDIVQTLRAHLSYHRSKSPRFRLSSQPDSAASPASASKVEQLADSSASAIVAAKTSDVPNSLARLCDHRGRQPGCRAPASSQLLRALSVSSVKKKSSVTVVLAHPSCDSAALPLSGGETVSMKAALEVPRDAILDFKQWMRQKQSALAAHSNLVPLSEVPETIAEDNEVCAMNRTLLRTCAKRPGTLQRPITPTIYGAARSSSTTSFTSLNFACAALPTKLDWLLPPSTSDSVTPSSEFRPQNKSARAHGALKPMHVLSAQAVEELPRLPSSFLPRELDPQEATRLQEQRQLELKQQQILAYEQETRSITPAAFNRLKRRVLGASVCAEDCSSPLRSGGDGVELDAEVVTPSSGFRLKRHASLRLRRLVL
jgi:hypothetical protein